MKNNLRTCRERAGLTRQELSVKAQVDFDTIWRLENGLRVTTSSKGLLRLADALDTSVDVLFFD